MSFVQIPNEMFKANLTSLQFRVLANFIRISGLNNGHSFFGYPNLADINQCGRAAIIKTVRELEELGFIEVVERGNRSRSNDILLTLDKGFARCAGGQNAQKEGYLKDTPGSSEGYLKDTRGYLKDTRGYLKDTPHEDLKDLNNLNLNNIQGEGYLKDTPNQEKEEKSKQIATGDGAPVRSMPEPDKSGRNQQEKVQAENQLDICDMELAEAILPVLKGVTHAIEVVRIGGQYGYRAICNIKSFRDKAEELRPAIEAAAAKVGRVIQLIPATTRYNGEIIINLFNYQQKGA